MNERPILKRNEVPVENTWDLSHLFATEEDWLKEYESITEMTEQFTALSGKLRESAQNLLAYFRLTDEASVRLSALYGYAHCHNDVDSADGHYVDLKSKAMRACVAVSTASSFADPEILAIPEETLSEFRRECPALSEYDRSLEKITRGRAHTLSPAEEELLAKAGELAETASNIRSTLVSADIAFPDVTDCDGRTRKLTAGTFVPLLESSDRIFRERVFRTYYSVVYQFRNTLAASLDGQFKQLGFFAASRHFQSTLEASLFSHEVPVDVYHSLISSVHENLEPMYRYVRLRRRALNVPELHMYDVYTPIVGEASAVISFDEARKTVLEALSVLGDDYTAMLREGFENRWIDVYENEGKRSGAYSTDVSRPHPYVLLNHKDNLDSMFTLAHEMGHALHSVLSTKNQPVSTSDYVIFAAEVASTVNEVLLMRYLLEKTSDKKQKAALLNHLLDQFKGTLYRQTMFAEFELEMGKLAEAGEALTADVLCEKYLALNRLYFGPDMISDREIGLEWARIPHFFYNYYVFQYATSFAAAVAIAGKILDEGTPAVEAYKRFLSGGCSKDPISLLKIAGVDMSTPEPVHSALRMFEESVKELEAII